MRHARYQVIVAIPPCNPVRVSSIRFAGEYRTQPIVYSLVIS